MKAPTKRAEEKGVIRQSNRPRARRMFRAVAGLFALALLAVAADKPPEPKQVPITAEQVQAIQALNQRAAQLQKERADFERATQAEGRVLQLEYDRFLDQQCRAAGGDLCAVKMADERGQALPPEKWTLVVRKAEPKK